MENKIKLTVKNMVKAYYDSNVDAGLWEAFLKMRYTGFVTEKEWRGFYDTCKSWFWNTDTNSVYISTATGEEEVRL